MTYRSDHPVLPVGTDQAAGYIGEDPDAPAAPLLPAQSAPGDVMELYGDGAPVDGADGTGAGQAGVGSRYTDTTAGDLYLNQGSRADPAWKLVTTSA